MKNKTDRSRLVDPQIIKITDTVSMIIITFHGRINILIGGGDSRISGSLERVREIVSTYNPQNYESLDRSFLELQHQKRLERITKRTIPRNTRHISSIKRTNSPSSRNLNHCLVSVKNHRWSTRIPSDKPAV